MPESIFETWINVCQAGGNGPDIVKDLAEQERITIHFHDRSMAAERSLQVYNSMRGFFETLAEQLEVISPWSMRQFDEAREKIYRQYPQILDLWRSLR